MNIESSLGIQSVKIIAHAERQKNVMEVKTYKEREHSIAQCSGTSLSDAYGYTY